MTILKILVAPDPRLKIKADPVPVAEINDALRETLDNMVETMHAAKGIGLAATQVGINKRMVVIDLANPNEGEEPAPQVFINPEITSVGDEIGIYQEGCLSVPTFYEDVERPTTCTVKYFDKDGNEQTLKADGLMATCIQHEIDHLDGVLFVDHISRLKKNMIIKKLDKVKKQGRFNLDYEVEV